jgi:DNA polymerase I-like protein with 3'-5' exonuclease and polymerase domains
MIQNIQLLDARTPQEIWLKFAADMAASDGVCGLDVETQDRNRHAGLEAFNNKVRHVFDHRRTVMTGFSVYPNGTDTAWYINLNQKDVENRLPPEIVRTILEMKPDGVSWISHNAPFELVMFEQCYDVRELLTDIICTLQMAVSDHGPDEYSLQAFYDAPLPIRPIVGDILETFRLYDKAKQGKNLNADQQFVLGQFVGKESDSSFSYNGFVKDISFGYGLKKIVKSLFGFDMVTYQQVLDAHGAEDMADLTGEDVCAYGADDAYWAVRVYHALLQKMLAENPAALVAFLETENKLVHVYADVWRDGLRINQDEVLARREDERSNYAQAMRDYKAQIRELLPFDDEPNAELARWQEKWYTNPKKGGEDYKRLRQRIVDWANSPDSDDDFEQAFQVSNPIGNAWATERGIPVPKSGKLNLTHYYQMRIILHDLMGHKLVRISGDITTDKDARARMADTYAGNDYRKLDVLTSITKITGIEQVMKLYLTPYTQLTDPETSCMYSVISSMLASRRMAMRTPNPTQLAKRGETAYVRGFYVADADDHVIVSSDWSSVELVEIGDFSGDPEFAEVFGQIPYGDLHSGAAVDCLRVDPRYDWLSEDEFLSELKRGRNPMSRTLTDFAGKELAPDKWVKLMRTEIGKGSNFNYWYSGALSTIAEKLGWDSATHWSAVDRYRERFQVAEQWRVDLIAEGCRNGFVTLPDGHRRIRIEATDAWFGAMRRKFADVCPDQAVMSFCDLALPRIVTRAKNQFVNSKIQGSCATLAKRSILNIREAVQLDGVRFVNQFSDAEKRSAMEMTRVRNKAQGLSRFMLPIHDELLFSVHRDYVPEFIPILREGMCNHPDIIRTLPLHCNVAVGRTFKPYDSKRPAYSQIELDEAPVIDGVIGEEFDGKPLPSDMIPGLIDWMMAA